MKEYTITINGIAYDVTVEEKRKGAASSTQAPAAPVRAEAPAAAPASAPGPELKAVGAVYVTAPMQGKILKVLKQTGDAAKTGETILILEAMKMENEITAPQDGVITSINAAEGESVGMGQVLATLE
nr:biotin/lipoyl-containing protein [uncultured Eubacterium sp.]